MNHIEVSGRTVFRDDEYYKPDDDEIIKLSFGNHSMYVKAVRRQHRSCKECAFIGSTCAAIPLKCTHHWYMALDTIMENL